MTNIKEYENLLTEHLMELNGVFKPSQRTELHVYRESDPFDDEARKCAVDVSVTLAESRSKQARLLQKALNKIKQGTFGLCEICDEPIEPQRLKAQPWAELCIEHQNQKERKDMRQKTTGHTPLLYTNGHSNTSKNKKAHVSAPTIPSTTQNYRQRYGWWGIPKTERPDWAMNLGPDLARL